MSSRPIYVAIMAAAERGAGIRLTADEVHELSMDDAIAHRAAVCLPDDDDFLMEGFTWTYALREGRALQRSAEYQSPLRSNVRRQSRNG